MIKYIWLIGCYYGKFKKSKFSFEVVSVKVLVVGVIVRIRII